MLNSPPTALIAEDGPLLTQAVDYLLKPVQLDRLKKQYQKCK